jgi:hypothetical protein
MLYMVKIIESYIHYNTTFVFKTCNININLLVMKKLPYIFAHDIKIYGQNKIKVRRSERLGGKMEAEFYY